MTDTINVGNVVKLRSGGPDMTVSKLKNGMVECKWFDGKKLQTANLNEKLLEIGNDGSLLDELNVFVDKFDLVFNIDWEFTQACIENPNHLIEGTFIHPGVSDEDNNWWNRGSFLHSWRNLLDCMKRLEVLDKELEKRL
ncbi:MAG: DUF2158 domain-containing protein [Rhodobacteraceae bacterium]|nr:DUF2158 domain-containing protein [Paracoccaceae bacterium]MYF47321.1 DUF2158 domain-containing protein [Paracoccaceae bacterium]MYI90943.1 DUF2158 domain-containing protein [Paracoccaceae bacterium]